ncbi:hypothetical protein Tco_0778833 [Tanacetum coccineum]
MQIEIQRQVEQQVLEHMQQRELEANAREQARDREWKQRINDINSVLRKFTDSRPLRGGRTREPTSRVGGRTGDQGGQGGDRGIEANGGDDKVPDFSTAIAQSANVSNGRNGCSYKEFMVYNLKDYDGKGGAIVYTCWIEKMESLQDMSGCGANQKTRGRESAVGMTWEDFKDLMRKEFCPNNEMQKLETRLFPHLVTPENKRIERYIYGLALQICAMVAAMEPTTVQSDVLKAGMLTDESIRNGSLKKNTKKRGDGDELSRK